MGFVMVPVPADHVFDVMRWVLLRLPDEEGDGSGRDEARLLQLMNDVDDTERTLLLLVAKAGINNDQLRLRDVADEIGESPGDLTERIRGLNRRALGSGRVVIRTVTEREVGVSGNTGKVTYLTMRADLARTIRAAARVPATDE